MTKAIGLIETVGVAISIEVADAMMKAADVHIVNQETFDAALITISIEGDLCSVREAMEAGKNVAQQTGQLFSACLLANPDHQLCHQIKKKIKKESFQALFPKER